MKKKIINSISYAFILGFIAVGCDSSGTFTEKEIPERTKIIMNTPDQVDIETYNWNNAQLVWSEEFNNPNSFEDFWDYENNNNYADTEDQLQNYTKDNIEVSDGILKIYASKTGAGQNRGDYTSGRISGKYAFQYGRIEVSAKLPEGERNGIWSKIALIGNNKNTVGYPNSGEIDIMEYFSYKPNETYILVHTAANNADNASLTSHTTPLESAEEEFHAYGILWTKNSLKFYIDDIENIIYTEERPSNATEYNWPFDQPFYLLMDMVVGGEYAGAQGVDDSLFPAIMEIDYIRVFHAK